VTAQKARRSTAHTITRADWRGIGAAPAATGEFGMTSLAMAEGWNMTGTGPKAARGWGTWREVSAAWAVAAVIAGALLVALPSHDRPGTQENLWSLSPAAGSHMHKSATDAEGPTDEKTCSDRDYANELC
jgi:hypothetical protein